MKSQNTKSSDQLKKEVDKEIRNVKRDLDELEGRLTPGQIIDDAIFYPHGRNLRSTLDHLKRNPVGTTFLSLGTILLMEDESHQTFESSARSKISTARSTLDEKVTKAKGAIKDRMPHKEPSLESGPSKTEVLKGKVQDKVEGAKESIQSSVEGLQSRAEGFKSSVQDTVSSAREGITEAKDNLQNKFQDNSSQFGSDAGTYDETITGSGYVSESSRIDKFKGKASELKGKASEKATELKEKASGFYSSGRDRVSNLDPMTYMALGAGLGVLTGASLPVSDKEQSFVDEKLSDKFSGLSQELQDAINESSNILKDLVIGDVKDMSFKVFRS